MSRFYPLKCLGCFGDGYIVMSNNEIISYLVLAHDYDQAPYSVLNDFQASIIQARLPVMDENRKWDRIKTDIFLCDIIFKEVKRVLDTSRHI